MNARPISVSRSARIVSTIGVTVPSTARTLCIVVCGAGPAPRVSHLVDLAHQDGWSVQIVATPDAWEASIMVILDAGEDMQSLVAELGDVAS